MQGFIGQKINQSQAFREDGTRIPVTQVYAPSLPVVSIKTKEKTGYWAIQLGFGTKKHPTKGEIGHARGAKLEKAPLFLREIRLLDEEAVTLPNVGDSIKASDILKAGDIVDVIGTSKGKGFAGVVKRHHFKGGPRTHGQSDRERAPGSIGQTTTPGRVYKGKKMAGRMGSEQITVKNVEIVSIEGDTILINGLVPGVKNAIIRIEKVGENKKFSPLIKIEEPQETDETVEIEEPQETEGTKETEETKEKTKEEDNTVQEEVKEEGKE